MTLIDLSESTPAQPVEALCCDRYYADLRDRFAFIFQVIETGTRFTVYTTGERFHVGNTYRVLLTGPDTVTLPMTVQEAEFLRTCLHNAVHRWREAITEADAGANRPHRARHPPIPRHRPTAARRPVPGRWTSNPRRPATTAPHSGSAPSWQGREPHRPGRGAPPRAIYPDEA